MHPAVEAETPREEDPSNHCEEKEDEQDGEDRVLKKARLEKLEPIEIAQKYENHYFHIPMVTLYMRID